MSDKPEAKLNEIDRLIRSVPHHLGQADDTVIMTVEHIYGFELFNTRPYHNYETWSDGYRVTGHGVTVAREDLDDAVRDWVKKVQEVKP